MVDDEPAECAGNRAVVEQLLLPGVDDLVSANPLRHLHQESRRHLLLLLGICVYRADRDDHSGLSQGL